MESIYEYESQLEKVITLAQESNEKFQSQNNIIKSITAFFENISNSTKSLHSKMRAFSEALNDSLKHSQSLNAQSLHIKDAINAIAKENKKAFSQDNINSVLDTTQKLVSKQKEYVESLNESKEATLKNADAFYELSTHANDSVSHVRALVVGNNNLSKALQSQNLLHSEHNQKLGMLRRGSNGLFNTIAGIASKARGITFGVFAKSINVVATGLRVVLGSLKAIYDGVKAIVFAGVAFATIGTATATATQKQNVGAASLGLRTGQLAALKNLGKIKAGGNEEYFTNMLGKFDNVLGDVNNAEKFANLGLDMSKYSSRIQKGDDKVSVMMDFIADLKKVRQTDNFKSLLATNSGMIQDSLDSILGVNMNEIDSMNPQALKAKYFNLYAQLSDSVLDTLGKTGEAFQDLLSTIDSMMKKIFVESGLVKELQKIFNVFKEGLAYFQKSDGFRVVMKAMSDCVSTIGRWVSSGIMAFFRNLPIWILSIKQIMIYMQLAFNYIKQGINDMIGKISKFAGGWTPFDDKELAKDRNNLNKELEKIRGEETHDQVRKILSSAKSAGKFSTMDLQELNDYKKAYSRDYQRALSDGKISKANIAKLTEALEKVAKGTQVEIKINSKNQLFAIETIQDGMSATR